MTRWGRHLLALAPGLAALSCSEPQTTPPPAAAPVPVAKVKPAPVVKPGVVTRMPLDTFFPLQQAGTALIYDVRPGIYYRFEHVPGAASWPKGSYDAQLATREPEIRAAIAAKRPVVLYCTDRPCPDAEKVATRLAARGLSVAILEGGYEDWKTAGMPSE